MRIYSLFRRTLLSILRSFSIRKIDCKQTTSTRIFQILAKIRLSQIRWIRENNGMTRCTIITMIKKGRVTGENKPGWKKEIKGWGWENPWQKVSRNGASCAVWSRYISAARYLPFRICMAVRKRLYSPS